MGIKDWPASERPRERLQLHGPEALSDAELLAVIIRTGRRGQTALDLARELIDQNGNLAGLVNAGADCRGLGEASAAELLAALEISRRALLQDLRRGDLLNSPTLVRAFLTARLRGLPHEAFACLFLDNRHALIRYEELFRGTIDGASVYPREVVKRALALNAAAVIFAHNHPSGVSEPSMSDQRLTTRLREALDTVDIRVLDHFVVGDGRPLSFAERGLL